MWRRARCIAAAFFVRRSHGRDIQGLALPARSNSVLVFAAAGEAATGVALLLAPALVGQLLFGVDLAGVAATVARVAGIALIALSIACWPGPPRVGMLMYSAAITLYLAYQGLAGGLAGLLLWPAVVLHVILTALLVRSSTTGSRAKT